LRKAFTFNAFLNRREEMSVTLEDVAKRAGVSPKTVSYVIRNLPGVSEETAKRVWQAINELGYRPNKAARNLATGKESRNELLAFLLPRRFAEVLDPFYYAVLRGAEAEVVKHNYSLIFSAFDDPSQESFVLPKCVLEVSVDGVLVAHYAGKEFLQILDKRGIPVVLIDAYLEDWPLNCVITDNEGGAFKAVSHLIELGHRSIACVTGHYKKPSSFRDRVKGYRRALEAHGIAFNEDLLVSIETRHLTPEDGYLVTKAFLESKPNVTAIFATNDPLASGVMRAIRELGLRIPDDISVIGFDDVDWAMHTSPALTTIRVFKEEMGRLAVQRLMSIINEPETPPVKLVMPTELIVRESTAPPPT